MQLPTITLPRINTKGIFEVGDRSTSSDYDIFKEDYFYNPVSFAKNCIDWERAKGGGLAFYQDEILSSLVSKKRVSVRGPHGLGKTAMAAITILWFSLTRDGKDWKIPTTASAWRQLKNFLWPEVRKWSRLLRWDVIGREPFSERDELLTLSLKLETGEAFAVASNDPQLIEGAHADHILYIFDESKAIGDDTFDAAEGAFSGSGDDTEHEAYAMAISTPGEPIGRFYDIQSRKAGYEDWWVRHVTLADTIKAGRVSQQWAEQRERQWGEKSSVFQNRVLGNFASADEDGIIPLSWVEMAIERWHALNDSDAWGKFVCSGVDVARYGSDMTEQALRFGNAIKEIRETSKESTMQTAGRVVGVLRANGGYANIDVIGIGSGVLDRVKEQGLDARPFNASARTDRHDKSGEFGFVNVRAGAWWNMREILDPDSGHDVALPDDDALTGELVAPRWRVMSGAKIKVESKEEIKKRIGRSTNKADGVIQAFWVGDIAAPLYIG